MARLLRRVFGWTSAPSAPTIVYVEATSSTSISVYWESSKNDGGSPITGYVVEYRPTSNPSFETQAVPRDVFSTTLDGLTPSTEYDVRVRGENAVGRSVPSATLQTKTDDEVMERVVSAGDLEEGESSSVGSSVETSSEDSEKEEADPRVKEEEKLLREATKNSDMDSFHQHLDELERLLSDDDRKKRRIKRSVLCYAAHLGSTPVVETLIEKGVDINTMSTVPEHPDYADVEMSPLHWAAGDGHVNIVKMLIEKGANLDSKDDRYGATPLHCAAVQGKEGTVQFLIEKGADINVKTSDGWTPLHNAAMQGKEVTVQFLVEKGVDIDIKDNDGKTPLHWAAEEGHAGTAQFLVEKGADINIKDNNGWTPLDWVTRGGHEAVVAYLKRAADPNMLEESESTGRQQEQRRSPQETAPSAPTILAVEAVSSTSLSVKWAVCTNDGGSSITGYVVEYRHALDPASPFETHLLGDDVFSTTLDNLVPSTEYEVRVRVENAVGHSDPSVTTRAKTKVDVKQIYEREMHYGHIETSIAKVLLFGIAGSGKTSATAILMGEDPPAARTSSSLMARPVQVITILINKLTKWEKKTPKEVRRIIAEIIRSRESSSEIRELQQTDSRPKRVKPKEGQPPLPTQPSQETYYQPKSSQPKQIHPKERQPLKPKSGFDLALESVMKEDDFLSLVQHCNPPSEPILEQKWLYIIDSGGQPEFHDMLSIFMQKTTACIFVCRMHDELDDYPRIHLYKDGSSIGPTHKSRLTNRQLFQQFMRTMRSFNYIKNADHLRIPPNILVLATHQDLVEGGKLPTSLENGLKAIVLPQFREQLIYCGTQLEKFIFTINAKNPEDRDRKTADEIRREITEKCCGERVKIPIRWYNLDHQSRRISDHLNRKVLSREEYGKIAKELDIDDESCEGALEFFNSLNTLFYLPKVLSNVLFLDPQILLNLLNELVAMKYRADEHATKPKKSDIQFQDVAQVTEELLNKFKEHYHPPLFTALKLAKLFEKLLIFGKLGEEKWFVPSILPSLKEEEVEQYRVSKEEALLIHFQDGGPQTGIFCSTVSFLLSTDNTSPCPWKVCKDHFGKPTCLKRNIIAFTVGKFPGKVTLIEEWTHFEIHLKTIPARERDLWKLVYKAVFKGLEKAAETHHHSNSDNFPCATIRCPEQCHDHPSAPHPATIDREGNWGCTKSTQWCGQVPTKTIPWLNLITEEVSGSQQQKKQSSGETGHKWLRIAGGILGGILLVLVLLGIGAWCGLLDSKVDPPHITKHPAPQKNVVPGSTVRFTVTATGGGDMMYKWQRDGTDFDPLPEGVSGETTSTLLIDNVEKSHQGDYRCIVSNVAGSTPSKCAQLTVHAPPTLVLLRHFLVKNGHIDIAQEIGTNYEKFGILLLEDKKGSIVDSIAKSKHYVPVDITVEILRQWLQGKGKKPVTWQTLVKCLRDTGLYVLAGKIDDSLSEHNESKENLDHDHPEL